MKMKLTTAPASAVLLGGAVALALLLAAPGAQAGDCRAMADATQATAVARDKGMPRGQIVSDNANTALVVDAVYYANTLSPAEVGEVVMKACLAGADAQGGATTALALGKALLFAADHCAKICQVHAEFAWATAKARDKGIPLSSTLASLNRPVGGQENMSPKAAADEKADLVAIATGVYINPNMPAENIYNVEYRTCRKGTTP